MKNVLKLGKCAVTGATEVLFKGPLHLNVKNINKISLQPKNIKSSSCHQVSNGCKIVHFDTCIFHGSTYYQLGGLSGLIFSIFPTIGIRDFSLRSMNISEKCVTLALMQNPLPQHYMTVEHITINSL